MGKFLRDEQGRMVALGGTPVLEKILDRKPRDCQSCGFSKWAKGDKLFILKANEWYCPDCAVAQGLPPEHYHRNHYATATPPPGIPASKGTLTTPPTTTSSHTPRPSSGLGECLACMCYF